MTGENFLPGKKDGERDRFGFVRFVYVFVILNIITARLRTRTAWAVFKYCGTNTASLGLILRFKFKCLVLGVRLGFKYKVLV
jgi:hypothetical protein